MTLEGDEALRSSLQRCVSELGNLEQTEDKAGQLLADRMQAEAPKLTGYMAGTVEHAGATVTVGAPYAGYVNAGNPFAARAMEAEQQRVIDIYAEDIAAAVSRIE